MAEFEVQPDRLKRQSGEMKKLAVQIGKYGEQIQSISRNLNGISGGAYDIIISALNTISEEVIQEKKSVESMGDVLFACAREYENTEKKIASAAPLDFSLHVSAEGSGPGTSAQAGVQEENGGRTASASASANLGKGEVNAEFGNGLYKLNGTGYLPGAEAAAQAGYRADMKNLETFASASASAYALKGELEQDQVWGLGKYKASGEVLSASSEAKAYASIVHNGVVVPSAGVEAKAKASVANGKLGETIGLEQYNIHAEAEGYVIGAEAEAKAKFGVIQEDGETSYGASAKAEAGAYLAKGEVKGGFTLFGIDIDAKVGGNIGAGGEAGASVTSDSINLSAGLTAILGVEVEINIDWSDFGW